MKYIIVDGEHCFRGVDIASILRYSRPVNAIRDQMPKKCKHTLDYVQAQATISGETPLTDLTDHKTGKVHDTHHPPHPLQRKLL